MEKRANVMRLMLILRLGLLLPVISGENCPVNPDCSCSGYSVYCSPRCGPSVPKFAASSRQFREVRIHGNRAINQILPSTFQRLSTRQMYIQNTGLTDVDCDAFKGINSGLETLSFSDNYLQSVPSCSFQHVKGITELWFTGNHISNLTRDAFINASGLRTLGLSKNKIESVQIGSFNTLDKLTYLNLGYNKISKLDGAVFRGLISLEYLFINRNKLKSIHPKSFDGLESLGYLALNKNEIGSLDGTTFEHLTNIKSLHLGYNLISSLPEKIFAKLVKLTRLDLEYNQLVSLPDSIFRTTPLLSILHMQGNNLSVISRRLLSSAPNLQTLDISENLIVNIDAVAFKGIKLRTINIDNNRLTTVQSDVFKYCNQLTQVSMKKNRIRDLQPGSFRYLSRLWRIDLSENYLNDIRTGVFENSTSLSELNLAANRISFIENRSLESQHKSLRRLNLQSNKLTYKAWVTLAPILTTPHYLYKLDLSHNPIGDLHIPAIDLLQNINDLSCRNCALTYFSLNTITFNNLDLSANALTNFSLSIDAPKDGIKNVDIISDSPIRHITSIQLSRNLISTSIHLKINKFEFYRLTIKTIDLSYNKFNNIASYPVRFNSSVPIDSDPYRHVLINTLDLSHNNISFVSPDAFLGTIHTLDLSHNRIEAFGRLLPVNASSSDFKTQFLDLSGNFIHRISSDVFSGHEKMIKNINLAQNSLTEIQSLRNVLEEESFERLYLSDNPLNCDCESFWLRQDYVASKLDSARCDTPDNAKGYMSFCYPLANCSPNQTMTISTSVLDLCINDTYVIISNLQLTTLETVGNSFIVNVTWASQGPRQITGYTLDITRWGNSKFFMTSLVHPAAVNYIIFGLELKMTYNVCISAQKEQRTVTKVLCTSLQVEDIITSSTVNNVTSSNVNNVTSSNVNKVTSRKVINITSINNVTSSNSTLIGISSALGLCVLCIAVMMLCYIFRLQKLRCCYKKDCTNKLPSSERFERSQTHPNLGHNISNKSNPCYTQYCDSNPTDQECELNIISCSIVSQTYEHPSNLTDYVNNSNTYETIHDVDYEN